MQTQPAEQALIVESAPHPLASILFLHGLGTRGTHFLPVIKALARALPVPVRFVLPTAPRRAVTVCQGQHLTAWFDLLNTNFVAREDEQGLRSAEAYAANLVEKEVEQGIAVDKIFIVGFSQGGALSLMTGLRFPHCLGGIAALSGWLPSSMALPRVHSGAVRETPVFLGHGSLDRITPLSMAKSARDWLESKGYKVSLHTYSAAHEIVEQEVHDLTLWLRDRLAQVG